MSKTDLQIKNLNKSYRTAAGAKPVCALDDVSLNVSKGEFIALQGASGSGKSTLLYTIAGLVTPDSGQVLIGSEDLTGMSNGQRTNHRSRAIGLVFQDFRLIPYLSVLENVALISNERDQAVDLLSSMQLKDRQHHKPSQLSAGEQQRCAIARALIHQPQLILADEPTGNLDAENSSIILDCLADYAQKGNIVVMASHDPAAVKATDRAVEMSDGKLQN